MATDKKPEGRGLVGAIGQFGVVIAMVLLTKTVAAEAYYVPSGSMLPSLLIGDQLLVTKYPYGYSRYSLPLPLAPASSSIRGRRFAIQRDHGLCAAPRRPRRQR